MLISETYKQQNLELHERESAFGLKGRNYAKNILAFCEVLGTTDVLDYGCGKGTLAQALPFEIKQYDPCIPGLDLPPEPADVLACTDVLEHIEPACLDDVLNDIERLTKKLAFLSVDVRPARKILSDGRNAHLIQEPAEWWFPKLYERFSSVRIDRLTFKSQTTPGLIKTLGFVAICGRI